jgi:hypothetical protein
MVSARGTAPWAGDAVDDAPDWVAFYMDMAAVQLDPDDWVAKLSYAHLLLSAHLAADGGAITGAVFTGGVKKRQFGPLLEEYGEGGANAATGPHGSTIYGAQFDALYATVIGTAPAVVGR